MSVDTKHKDYADIEKRWKTVEDVCAGAYAMKQGRENYLPKPNASDDTLENNARYDAYLTRAVFFEVTKDTLQKLIGIAFAEDPAFDPDGMDFLASNADGSGKSLFQLNQTALEGLLKKGRGGFFVDYPKTERSTSLADVEKLGIRPTVIYYKAENILNWRVKRVGSLYKTSLVVLAEKDTVVDPLNEFSLKEIKVYRVLRLDENNEYCVQTYSDRTGNLAADTDPYYPTQANKQRWNEIPFQPLGSFSNDWAMDNIPLESLALMNIAHYHNSAEYENSVFYAGQVQPVMTELDSEWRDWLQEKGVRLGSGNVLMLPVGGKFDFVQPDERTLAKSAMEAKEKYMASLGAKLLEENQVVKTATQSNNEALSQYSVLSLCVANLNEAAENVLRWCAMYFGAGDKARFSIKQDFARGKLSTEDLKFYFEQVLQGKMSMRTFHELRTTGKVPEVDFDEEQLRIEQENEGKAALPVE